MNNEKENLQLLTYWSRICAACLLAWSSGRVAHLFFGDLIISNKQSAGATERKQRRQRTEILDLSPLVPGAGARCKVHA